MDACVAALAVVHDADRYPLRWPADPVSWLAPRDRTLAAWVAETDTGIVGHVMLSGGQAAPELAAAIGLPQERVGVVVRLFLLPAARGHDLAIRLMETVTREAYERQLQPALEVVDTDRAAIKLYRRLSWRHEGSAPATFTTLDNRSTIVHYFVAPPP
jgi:GNAT superfamily N-acetyltransferase